MQVFPDIFIMDIILEALYFFKCLNLKHLPKKIPKFSINSIREELKTNYIFFKIKLLLEIYTMVKSKLLVFLVSQLQSRTYEHLKKVSLK